MLGLSDKKVVKSFESLLLKLDFTRKQYPGDLTLDHTKQPLLKKGSELRRKHGNISLKNLTCTVLGMAFPVVEFSREGYKIRKVFG